MKPGTCKSNFKPREFIIKTTWLFALMICLATVPLQGALFAKPFLEITSDTNIPVVPNGLGNVVPDSLINLLDLVRLRDIANGINGAPTPDEMVQGDLNIDGAINDLDLEILGKVLMQQQGPPQFLDSSTGGQVVSENVAMTFSPGDMGSSAVMGISKKSKEQLRGETGVDFQDLAADSTYYITGWQLDSTSDDYVYPPAMEINIDEMPPCELDGSNLLMTTRTGPLGNTELVVLTELEVAEDSTLVSPPPPYPVIEAPAENQFEPLQYIRIPVQNFSKSLNGNAVIFTQNEESWVANRTVWFEPINYSEISEIENIVVAVPDLPPGPTTMKLLHLGTGLESDIQGIEMLPLHIPSDVPGPELAGAFATIDSFLAIYPDFSVFQDYPFTLNAEWREETSLLLRPTFLALEESILNDTEEIQSGYLAWMDNLDLVARIDTAITYFDQDGEAAFRTVMRAAISICTFGSFGREAESGGFIPSSVPSGFGTLKSSDMECARDEISFGTDIGDLEAEVKKEFPSKISKWSWANKYWSNGKLPGISYSPLLPNSSENVLTPYGSDPSFNPEKYPNFCINIWVHNTNARGGTGFPGDCFPTGGKQLPQIFRQFPTILPSTYLDLVGGFISPLVNAVVTPVNGGIPGIVGIVDGAGSFAIPGLTPGEEIHFSIYDPKTGMYDPDAGYATSPNIAEQGVWFPACLIFQPETTLRVQSLDLWELVEDFIDQDQQRIEFVFNRDYRDPAVFSIGFCATVPMKFEITAPNGDKIVDLHDDTSFLDLSFVADQEGEHSIVVAFGTSVQDGSFILKTWRPYFYPMQQIVCEAWGPLHEELSPYLVSDNVVVPVGEELLASPGLIIEFAPSTSISGEGEFRGSGQPESPLILRPSESSVVFK